MTVSTVSPAKINLFLAVGPPDAIGYHPLRTVFMAVSLSDTVKVGPSHSGHDEIECNWPGLPQQNTLTKTLNLLRELVPVPPLKIVLDKQIPAESGLGGGSSNAAALLRAINRLRQNDIEDHTLLDVASAVGADVPFFLVGGLARATGYGDKVMPLTDPPRSHVLIVRPETGVSTPAAYQALDHAPREFKAFPDDPLDPRNLYNDFERIAPCVCGDLAERLQTHGAHQALLCGSGSAVFGLFPDEKTTVNAQLQLKKEGFETSWVCHSLTATESTWTTS